MTKKEYEKRVKEKLYNYFGDSRTKEYINSELAKEKYWFFSYYYDTKKEDWKYSDEYAISCAVDNFTMWL